MIIFFKNGRRLKISQDDAELLSQKIREGAKQFQIFINAKNKTYLIINLLEVESVQEEESRNLN